MNPALEIKLIKNFVVKEKQERYIQFVGSKKARPKFIRDLGHFRHFDWKLFEEVNGNHCDILDRLEFFTGDRTSCYVISENYQIDQKVLPIKEVLMQIGTNSAIILVFGNAEMIYFEGEPPFNRYISKILK